MKHVVLYTDGGAKPNPGFTGGAFILYVYDDESRGKRRRLMNHLATAGGFVKKDEEKRNTEDSVVPERYITGVLPGKGTNNTAELEGAINGFNAAAEIDDLDTLLIKMDSMYVKNYVDKLITGASIVNENNKNGEWVAALEEAYGRLAAKDVKVSSQHVYGHRGNLGNDLADELATLGVTLSKNEGLSDLRISEFDKTPFIAKHKRHALLGSITSLLIMEKPFYNGDFIDLRVIKYKDRLETGKPTGDALYGYIRLAEDDAVLKLLLDRLFHKTRRKTPIMIDIHALYSEKVMSYVGQYGGAVINIERNKFGSTMIYVGNTLVGIGLIPAGLAIEAYDMLDTFRDAYELTERHSRTSYDITDMFFGEKGFNNDLKPGVKEITTKIKVNGYARKHTLVFNVDLPDRNTLKRLEKLEPKIELITIGMNKSYLNSFITISLNDGSWSVWGNPFSNKILTKGSK